MSKKITTKARANNRKAYCHFCGSTVGQRSDRTEEIVAEFTVIAVSAAGDAVVRQWE